jgi:hypothetical protein
MSNTWDAAIATLAPTHYWKLDEASGLFLDTGSDGTLDLSEFTAGQPWRQAPSMSIRGSPRQHALWGAIGSPGGSGATRSASGLPTVGHTTGTFIAVVYTYSLAAADLFPVQQTFLNNAGLFVGFRISASGAVTWVCQANAGQRNRAVTVAGAVIEGSAALLCGVQRGDGTGMHVFIDGVDATNVADFAGGGITTDSYVADILVGTSATDLDLNGQPNAIGGPGGQICGPCGIWVNTALSDLDILNLFNSIGGFDQTPSDYFETIIDLSVRGDIRHYVPGWNLTLPQSRTLEIVAEGGSFDNMSTASFQVLPSMINVADSGGKGEQRVTPFPTYHYLSGSNNAALVQGFDVAPVVDGVNDFVGTINVVVKISSAPVAVIKNVMDLGAGTSHFKFQIVGGVLGYSVRLRMEGGGGDFWMGVSVQNTFPSTDIKMFTIVQDGTGVKMYIDGNSEAFVASSSGASRTDLSWLSTIYTIFTAINIGSLAGSPSTENWEPNEIHDVLITRTPFTADDVAQLWDALNSEFLPGGTPGAWFDALDTTGNAGAGPDWWWRMNVLSGLLSDVGSAQDRPGPTPPPINGSAIAELGDPTHSVAGPLPSDPTNAAIFFDGMTDAFEIGVNGVAGELCDTSTGTVGFFFSRASLNEENIVYSQGNDAYTSFWQFGMNAKRLELIVQTSAGNRVTLTGSIDHDGEFVEAVLTCDGSQYRLYDGGIEDTLATVVELGTGLEGDWFDAFTADQSAIGARADSTFTTETTGRPSEVFIFDGEVLSASEVAALAAAAVVDGITGTPNTVGVVTFENVTFRNGAFADIRAEESTGDFKQVIKANRCKFLAGAEGSVSYRPQVAIFKGPAQVQFRGCEFDLELAFGVPLAGLGRGGIVGSAINTGLQATVDGSLLVSDCKFTNMGFLDGSDFLAAVMAEAAFGMTVEHNVFNRSLGAAVGWNADAQRVSVLDNQIQSTQGNGVRAGQGLNARLGSGWTVRGNKVLDNGGNAIDLDGRNSVNTPARNIAVLQNQTNSISGSAIRVSGVADVLVEDNVGNGSTNGVELGLITDTIVVRRNKMNGCSLDAYVAAQGSLQAADVTFDRNTADPLDSGGDGISVTQLRRVDILNNKLAIPLGTGVSIGEISVEAVLAHNQIEAVTPLELQLGTSRAEFVIGRNQIRFAGDTITVGTAVITVSAHYHTITAGAPIDLDTIDGPNIDGFVLILRRALFSSNITLRDGIDNLNLGADFVMDVDNDQIWLVRDGVNWNQLARAEAL